MSPQANNTSIEWTDKTWNIATGCDKVSPGCDHCYAETFSERFRGVKGNHFEHGFDLQLRPERMDIPLHTKKPSKFFVNSMSDWLHKDIPDDYILQMFDVMLQADQHIYQLLTKRPGRLADSDVLRLKLKTLFMQRTGKPDWPAHIWNGVSVESQAYTWRIHKAVIMRAPVTFVSAEPLLGPLNLQGDGHYCLQDLAWIIAGAESGHGARPMDEDWVRSLRDQCQKTGVAFFYKQNAKNGRKIPTPELDGRTWVQYPQGAQA